MDSSCKKCVSVGAEGVRRMPMTRRRRRQRGRAAFVPAPFFRVKECPASKQAVSSDSTSRRAVGQSASHRRASETQPCETKLGANHWLPGCWGQTKTGAQMCLFLLILSREGGMWDGVPPVPERRHQHPEPCSLPAQPAANKENPSTPLTAYVCSVVLIFGSRGCFEGWP